MDTYIKCTILSIFNTHSSMVLSIFTLCETDLLKLFICKSQNQYLLNRKIPFSPSFHTLITTILYLIFLLDMFFRLQESKTILTKSVWPEKPSPFSEKSFSVNQKKIKSHSHEIKGEFIFQTSVSDVLFMSNTESYTTLHIAELFVIV